MNCMIRFRLYAIHTSRRGCLDTVPHCIAGMDRVRTQVGECMCHTCPIAPPLLLHDKFLLEPHIIHQSNIRIVGCLPYHPFLSVSYIFTEISIYALVHIHAIEPSKLHRFPNIYLYNGNAAIN